MDEFCGNAQKSIYLWMQTRPETINDDIVSKLKKVGLHRNLSELNMETKSLEKEF